MKKAKLICTHCGGLRIIKVNNKLTCQHCGGLRLIKFIKKDFAELKNSV